MDPKYPLVNEYHEYSMGECKAEVSQTNFNQSISHDGKIIETMYPFPKLPPFVHPIPILRSPADHFLMPEADDYYNVKPNLIVNQNSTAADEYQLPFLPIQHVQKFTNYDTAWQPNLPKQEPLDLHLRPFADKFSGAQKYVMQDQQFAPNRTPFVKPNLKSIKREKPKINPIGANYPIDDDTLLRISIPDLNQQLKTTPTSEKEKLKKKRRQLKNRKYAESCRQRRKEHISELVVKNNELRRQIENLRDVQTQNNKLRSKIENLENEHERLLRDRPNAHNDYKECANCGLLQNKLQRALQDVLYYEEKWTLLMAKIDGGYGESEMRVHTIGEYNL